MFESHNFKGTSFQAFNFSMFTFMKQSAWEHAYGEGSVLLQFLLSVYKWRAFLLPSWILLRCVVSGCKNLWMLMKEMTQNIFFLVILPLPSSERESFDSKTKRTLVGKSERIRSMRKYPEVPYFIQAADSWQYVIIFSFL